MDTKTKKILKEVDDLRQKGSCLFKNIKVTCSDERKGKNTKGNHLIQRSNYLESIAINDEVMYFNIEDMEYYQRDSQLLKKNIKRVHKYNVVCGNHDKDLFSEIENGNVFNENNKKQCFQFALRAFMFNYSEQELKNNFKLKTKTLEKVASLALEDRKLMSQSFKLYYENEQWDVLNTYVIKLEKKIGFISCSSFYPFFDIDKKYRGYIKKDKIFFNIFPKENESYIVMSHFKDASKCCENFCKQICAYSEKNKFSKVEKYLSKIIVAQDKYITLSPNLWEDWSDKEKSDFYKYAHLFKRGGVLALIFKLIQLKYSKPIFNLFKQVL